VPEMNFNKGGVTGGKVQLEISGQLQAEQFPGVNPCNHNDGRRPTVALGVSRTSRGLLFSIPSWLLAVLIDKGEGRRLARAAYLRGISCTNIWFAGHRTARVTVEPEGEARE